MPDTTDRIAEQIERAIGDAPPSPLDLGGLLHQGRRAQVRRRVALGAGTAAAALVVAGGAWALSPGGDTDAAPDEAPVASNPTADVSDPAPSPSADPPADSPASTRWYPGEKVRYRPATGLEVRPGWTLLDEVEHPAGPRSWAAEVSKGERLGWYLFTPAATFGSDPAPEPGYADFAEWVDVNAPIAADMGKEPDAKDAEQNWPGEPRDDLVRFAPRSMSCCTLLPADDSVRIVEERVGAAVDLPDSFAGPADLSAAALVDVGGERWFVLARRGPDLPEQFIGVPAAWAHHDFDTFLQLARNRYAEGGGGLL